MMLRCRSILTKILAVAALLGMSQCLSDDVFDADVDLFRQGKSVGSINSLWPQFFWMQSTNILDLFACCLL